MCSSLSYSSPRFECERFSIRESSRLVVLLFRPPAPILCSFLRVLTDAYARVVDDFRLGNAHVEGVVDAKIYKLT